MSWDLAYIEEPQDATCNCCGTDASELQCIICDKEFSPCEHCYCNGEDKHICEECYEKLQAKKKKKIKKETK